MPEVRALKSFKGRYGHIRTGQEFTAEPGYAAQLVRNKLVKLLGEKAEPGPSNDRNRPSAPGRAGKEQPGKGDPGKPSDPPSPAAGAVLTSSSVQAGQASRRKTLPVSGAGGRRGTPTPRKGKTKTSSTSTPKAGGA